MFFLALCFLILSIPYGIEFFYFGKRFWIFAAFFWLFTIQVIVMFGGDFILSQGLGQSLPDWIKMLGTTIGVLTVLSIGFTPMFAAFTVAIFCVIGLSTWYRKTKNLN